MGSGRTGKVRRSFPTLAAARSWRTDALKSLERGELKPEPSLKVRDAADRLLEGMHAGSVRTRSGETYKPSVIRGYDQALALYVLPSVGAMRLSRLRRRDVQALADRLVFEGKSPSTVRNALIPLRVIYRRAVRDGDVSVNPCMGIDLPARREKPRVVPDAKQAAELLEALPLTERPLWATALYAGLRLGELRALVWDAIDLDAGVIRVKVSMDARGELVTPKSMAGVRSVPIPRVLRGYLLEQRLQNHYGYVFGVGGTPFRLSRVRRTPGLHACRHAYASFMIAAGVNAKTLSTYMGHSSITITIDRYGHLFAGNEAEAAGLLDAYLDAQSASHRE